VAAEDRVTFSRAVPPMVVVESETGRAETVTLLATDTTPMLFVPAGRAEPMVTVPEIPAT